MFFQKKKLSNGLTKLIETNPNVKIETILLHNDLSSTIRNESEILHCRILLKNKNPWFKDLIDYAFFDKTPPEKFQEYNTVNQINKNASSFFENCGKRFIQYFKEDPQNPDLYQPKELQKLLINYINKFITDEKQYYLNHMYAGHFQRFIENFLRHKGLEQEQIIPKIAPFLIKNCRILAYQQLLAEILGDYDQVIETEIIYDILTQMLQQSCTAVKYIRDHKKPNRLETVLYTTKFFNRRQKIDESSQPLNIEKKPIPFINFVFDNSDDVQDLNESSQKVVSIPWNKKDRSKPCYKNKEDAEIEAYLLLMSIRTSFSEQPEIVQHFRNDKNYPLIQALFYCGTRCDVKSLISLESFRILSIVFNGSMALMIEKWMFLEEEKSKFDFYNRFADEMIFDPTCLTYKMIHALPIFWNHRYNKDKYKQSEEEKKQINTEDYFNDGKKHLRKKEKGETALEILQPCLFCEPTISSQLSCSCTDILIQLTKMRRELYENDKNKELMIKIDGVILDFYTHQFNFGREFKKTTLAKLVENHVIVPMLPFDKVYVKVVETKRRALLNGFVVDFFCRMISMRVNFFFIIKDNELRDKKDVNNRIITEMGKSHCLSVNMWFYDYKDCTHFEFLDEKTLYNIPVNSGFCFYDDDLDENDVEYKSSKRKIVVPVIVDELAKSKLMKKKKITENDDDDKKTKQKKKKSEDDDDKPTKQKKKISEEDDDKPTKQKKKISEEDDDDDKKTKQKKKK